MLTFALVVLGVLILIFAALKLGEPEGASSPFAILPSFVGGAALLGLASIVDLLSRIELSLRKPKEETEEK